MYVGLTREGLGLNNLVFLVVEHFLWAAKDISSSKIEAVLESDESCKISMFGFGLSTAINKAAGITQAEVAMTQLGGSGDSFDWRLYHGTGPAPVNFLSKRFELKIWRAGIEYHLNYNEGINEAPMSSIRSTKDQSGTSIHFWPDPTVFSPHHFDAERIEIRLREYAADSGRAEISFKDRRNT